MNALVVVESMWGNTHAIGDAVSRGLGPDTVVVDIGDAPSTLPGGVDLLVVGGPTHALSMSRATTRHEAVKQGAHEAPEGTGIREWLDQLPPTDGVDVATFDTRVAKARRLPGSAAKAAGKEVRRHHLGRLLDTESFYVDDTEGPLLDGELERAQQWGAHLGIVHAHTSGAPRG